MRKWWILVPLPPLPPLPLPRFHFRFHFHENVVILSVAIPPTNVKAASLADRFHFRIPAYKPQSICTGHLYDAALIAALMHERQFEPYRRTLYYCQVPTSNRPNFASRGPNRAKYEYAAIVVLAASCKLFSRDIREICQGFAEAKPKVQEIQQSSII